MCLISQRHLTEQCVCVISVIDPGTISVCLSVCLIIQRYLTEQCLCGISVTDPGTISVCVSHQSETCD